MNCDVFLDRASDYVDGTLTGPALAEAEAHLGTCAACSDLVTDLRRVRQLTARLDPVAPPPHTWARVLDRLQADPAFATTSAASEPQRPSPAGGFQWGTWLALAATLIIAVSASLYYVLRVPVPTGPAQGGADTQAASGVNPPAAGTVEEIEKELQLAAGHYEKAIQNLEQVANASDSPIDPDVMAMLKKNLELIDGAIDESRAALKAEPSSRVAQESLFDAFRRKVALLQDTIALMNEMRKGNPEGAARVVEGLNKS